DRPRLAAEDLYVGCSPGSRAGNDLGDAISIDVAGRYVHAASKARGVGQEPIDLTPVASRKNLDVRRSPRTGSGDHIGRPIAIHITGRHPHSTHEGRAVG